MTLHIWAILLSLLGIAVTAYGLRSAYIITILNCFYAASLALNLLTTLHDRAYSWTGLVMVSQVAPFLYCTYRIYLVLVVLIPMTGRLGSALNPDLVIAVVTALGTIFACGFLVSKHTLFSIPYIHIESKRYTLYLLRYR